VIARQRQRELDGDGTVGVGASLGVAALPQQAGAGEALVGAADRAAYAAKDAGKGRVGRSGTS